MSNVSENGKKKLSFIGEFRRKHPTIVEFIVFFLISNGVTVLQMILQPLIKYLSVLHRSCIRTFRCFRSEKISTEAVILCSITRAEQYRTVEVVDWRISSP